MTSITNHTHPLTQVTMSDGTRYDVTVSFLDQNGRPLSLEDFHDYCPLDNNTALKEQLSSLLKAVSETHASHAKITSFRDVKVMTLTNQGIAFDQKPIKAHDIDVDKSKINTFTQDTPTREFLNTCNKVSDVWNKASGLILEDYNHHTQDCIKAGVDENAAEAAAFNLIQQDDHDQGSVTIHTVPLKKEPDSSDDEGPTPPGYSVSGALNAIGNGLYSVGTALARGVQAVGERLEQSDMFESTTDETPSSSDLERTLPWPESLDSISPEDIKTKLIGTLPDDLVIYNDLRELREAFYTEIIEQNKSWLRNKTSSLKKSPNSDTAFQTLIDSTYTKTIQHGFGAFIKALESQKESLPIELTQRLTQSSDLTNFTEDLKRKIADATIEKLKAYIKGLDSKEKAAKYQAIYPVLIDSSINSTRWTEAYFTDTIHTELFPKK